MLSAITTKSLLLAACLSTTCAYGKSPAVSVGTQALNITVPASLEDMRANQRVMEWAAATTEPQARLLTVLVEKDNPGVADLKIVRFVVVKTARRWEQSAVERGEFQQMKTALKRSTKNLNMLAALANSNAAGHEKELSKAIGAQMEQISIGKDVLVEPPVEEELAFSYLHALRSQVVGGGQTRTWTTLICSNTLWLKKKLLFINVYSLYRDDKDLQWVKTTCRELVQGAVAGN